MMEAVIPKRGVLQPREGSPANTSQLEILRCAWRTAPLRMTPKWRA